ncbi:MAG: sulfatase-like hydrolase/transferase [Chitinophagaceae bacterium]
MRRTSVLNWSFTANIYVTLLYRLAIVILIFTISRFLFYLLNTGYFPGVDATAWAGILRGGLRFDIAALFYVNGLFILLYTIPIPLRYNPAYQKIAKIVFIVTNSVSFAMNCIDFIYFRFTLRRSTLDVLREFSNEKGKGSFVLTFLLDYWYLVLIYAILIALMIWLYNRANIRRPAAIRPLIYYPAGLVVMAAFIAMAVGGIRGDFKYSTRPITMSNAGEYVDNPGEIPLVLNTPFCIIRTAGKRFYKEEKFFTADEVEGIYSPVQELRSDKPFKPDNVVVIILESFGKEGIGFYNHDLKNGSYKGFTPFLDSLFSVSRICWNSFANGRKSIDAMPSVLAGIPAGEIPFVLTPYASNKIKSLPSILRDSGYHTSFFHGAPNGSMGFKAFANLMDIERYYGKDEYNNNADFDGLWGIWDEPFFQFFAKNLDTIQQPFFSTIFSVSSHHPFKVPKQYEGVFPKGDLPLHECMGYTDMALRKFFATASTMKWFKNTLFVITADHATVSEFPEYQTAWGNLSIPIALYHPGDSSLAKLDSSVVQQIDIMPSVLSYLHYNGKLLSFGESIFDLHKKDFAASYLGGFQWIQDKYLLQFDGLKASGLFDYRYDRLMKTDLKDQLPAVRDSLEMSMKAFIQQYHNRLIQDRMLP